MDDKGTAGRSQSPARRNAVLRLADAGTVGSLALDVQPEVGRARGAGARGLVIAVEAADRVGRATALDRVVARVGVEEEPGRAVVVELGVLERRAGRPVDADARLA